MADTRFTEEVERLANTFELKGDRIAAAFAKFDEVLLRDFEGCDVDVTARCQFISRVVADAFKGLGSADGLQFLEETPAGGLLPNLVAAEWLSQPQQPFYSRQDLKRRVESFIAFLEEHRDFIIQTGHPPRVFRDCPWLFARLARLYPTRQTGSPWPVDFYVSSRQVQSPPPTGAAKCERIELESLPIAERLLTAAQNQDAMPRVVVPGRSVPPFTQWRVDEGIRHRVDDWQDASILPGIAEADAEWIEENRANLFGLKLAILEAATAALEANDADALFELLRGRLSEFQKGALDRFLRIDRAVHERDFPTGGWFDGDRDWALGGLSDILEFVGHVFCEIQTGAFAEIARDLARLRQDYSQNTREQEESSQPELAYFRLVSTLALESVNDLLAITRELMERLRSSREVWLSRLATIFPSDIEFVFRTTVPRARLVEFKAFVESATTVALNGPIRPQELQLADQRVPIAAADNTFSSETERAENVFRRRDNGKWHIRYQGIDVALDFKKKGCEILELILYSPSKDFSYEELESGLDILQQTNVGARPDIEALRSYHSELRSIEEEISEAERNRDNYRAERLANQKADILSQLNQVMVAAGIPLEANELKRGAANRVQRRVRRCIADIGNTSAGKYLAKHLTVFVSNGPDSISYQPDSPINWSG